MSPVPLRSERLLDWMDHAACRDIDPELKAAMFPAEGSWLTKKKKERLRVMCEQCPVFADCQGYVDEFRDEEGFFAGETGTERKERWQRESKEME